jgi:hypothetical protein
VLFIEAVHMDGDEGLTTHHPTWRCHEGIGTGRVVLRPFARCSPVAQSETDWV